MELMVIVAVVSVLAAIASPSMLEVARTSRLDTVREQVAGAIRLARSEALKRAGTVMVEPETAGDWSGPLVVYVDTDNDRSNARRAADDPLVRQFQRGPSVSVATGAPARIALDPRGQNVALTGAANPVSSVITLCSPSTRRTLTVENSGVVITTSSTSGC